MNQNNKFKKSAGGNRSNEAEMRKALQGKSMMKKLGRAV